MKMTIFILWQKGMGSILFLKMKKSMNVQKEPFKGEEKKLKEIGLDHEFEVP